MRRCSYVTVDEEAGRSLFYVFVESQNDPATDPVVLWLNGCAGMDAWAGVGGLCRHHQSAMEVCAGTQRGLRWPWAAQWTHSPAPSPLTRSGPGCSSLGGGFLSELGPFYPTTRGQLEANDYAWNQQASVIFVEAPAFVGFSYSNTSADRIVGALPGRPFPCLPRGWREPHNGARPCRPRGVASIRQNTPPSPCDPGDDRTARDNHEFLKRWFDRFPQYRANSFWVSGESYAGHYVPTLAREIIRGNRNVSERPFNFRGLLVGAHSRNPGLAREGSERRMRACAGGSAPASSVPRPQPCC